MTPKEFFAYQCGKCNKAYFDKDAAVKCCAPKICGCGNTIEYTGWTKCQSCIQKGRYERATKVNYKDYKIDMFYDETTEQYFREYEDMLDYHESMCEGAPEDTPKWAFGCRVHEFKINVENSIESECEEMWDDFEPMDELKDLQELYDFVDDWNDKQTTKSYYPNYSIIVEFDTEVKDENTE